MSNVLDVIKNMKVKKVINMCLDRILRKGKTLAGKTTGYVVVHKIGDTYFPLHNYIVRGNPIGIKIRRLVDRENGWHGFRTIYGAISHFHEVKYYMIEADTIIKCLFEEIETSGVVMVSEKKFNGFTARYRTILEEVNNLVELEIQYKKKINSL